MSKGGDTPFVVQAHACVNKAEEAKQNREWEIAVELYNRAAELFLLATNQTSDLESIRALQLLSTSQSNQAKEIQKQLRMFKVPQILSNEMKENNKEKAEVSVLSVDSVSRSKVNAGSRGEFLDSSYEAKSFPCSDTTQSTIPISYKPPSESFLSGSQTFFVGQTPTGSAAAADEILLFYPSTSTRYTLSSPDPVISSPEIISDGINPNRSSTSSHLFKGSVDTQPSPYYEIPLHEQDSVMASQIPKENENRPPVIDLWHWMERMLEILPKPIVDMASLASQTSNNLNPSVRREPFDRGESFEVPRNISDSSLLNSFYLMQTPPLQQQSIQNPINETPFFNNHQQQQQQQQHPMPNSSYTSPLSSRMMIVGSDTYSPSKEKMTSTKIFSPTSSPETPIDASHPMKDNSDEEILKLSAIIEKLRIENESLKELCKQAAMVSKENEILKKTIDLFRRELQKKASQLRQSSIPPITPGSNPSPSTFWISQQSNSVGNLPQVLYGLARTEQNSHSENTGTTPEPSLSAISSIQTPIEEKNRSLQAKVNELSSEIQSLLEKCSKQVRHSHSIEFMRRLHRIRMI